MAKKNNNKQQKKALKPEDYMLGSREITEFQRKVYMALLDVPRGETITYGETRKAHRLP